MKKDIKKMKKITKVINGLLLLKPYCVDMNVEVVPRSFPNGSPNHSNSSYICVEIDFNKEEPAKEICERLKELGWNSECEGQFFTFYFY